ncbi:MAG: RHS repeat protein, partial [Chloroflexi bacterium]|nr:RHS repeat protein [Chloroflexota bacterium]
MTVTVGGVATTYQDTNQILNTGGIDKAVCIGANESSPWSLIGGPTVLPGQPAPTGSGTYPPGLPSSGTSTDPVNTLTGNYGYSHTDLAIPGRGPSPLLIRSLNTLDTRSSSLGVGWTHNYSMHLASPGVTNDVLLVGPQGRTDRYTSLGGGNFAPPPGVNTQLVLNSGGTLYTATLVDQTKWTFNQLGQLTAITDRYGNQSNLTYNAFAELASVSDPAARGSLTFTYDPASGLLTSVTDWTGRVVKYGYDTNSPPRLKTVTDRNNQVTTYAYDGATQHLTSI